MQAGPNIPGQGDSGCWYNVFDTILIIYTIRGIWLRDPVNNVGSSVNRNQFSSVRIGQRVNTGVQIDAGDTNSFFGCSFEGIQHGIAPNGTPTAILIQKASATGAANESNAFMCARFEGNALDLDNNNGFTEMFASNVRFGETPTRPSGFRGDNPLYVVGGYAPSYTPMIMPGIVYPEGSLPNVPSEINFTKPVRFQQGFTNEKP